MDNYKLDLIRMFKYPEWRIDQLDTNGLLLKTHVEQDLRYKKIYILLIRMKKVLINRSERKVLENLVSKHLVKMQITLEDYLAKSNSYIKDHGSKKLEKNLELRSLMLQSIDSLIFYRSKIFFISISYAKY